MIERIILAAVITLSIYLFLNAGQAAINSSVMDTKRKEIPEFVHWLASFSF